MPRLDKRRGFSDPGSPPAKDTCRPAARRIRRALFWNAAARAAASIPVDAWNTARVAARHILAPERTAVDHRWARVPDPRSHATRDSAPLDRPGGNQDEITLTSLQARWQHDLRL